ncbi:hypothetical protein CVO79_18365 [Escherichia coli]|nr:hypothetical protein CVO79_18365 [Escherichia coli]
MGNIHGISCTANNYLKQAWNDIKNEYEKNQTYSITLLKTHWCVLCGCIKKSDVNKLKTTFHAWNAIH